MKENGLRYTDGKKIRRQYFNAPLIILYTMMLAIPWAIFTISWCMGKSDIYVKASTFWTSICVCFVFSLPFLILRVLNKHCFGRIICVLNEKGVYYSDKRMLCWDSVEKVEYVMGSKPRYKNDTGKMFRVIFYKKGGKHVVLDSVPLYIVSQIKKYKKDTDVKILGVTSLLPPILIMSAILFVLPFYVVLLKNAPNVSGVHILVSAVIFLIIGVIRNLIFDIYNIPYRFWSKILPKKWLSYTLLAFYYPSFFIVLLVLFYFPNLVVAVMFGIYLGIVRPPIPSRHGNHGRNLKSYDELCDIYIKNADIWEKNIEKNKEKRKKYKTKI